MTGDFHVSIDGAPTVGSQANGNKGEEALNQADRIDPRQHDGRVWDNW